MKKIKLILLVSCFSFLSKAQTPNDITNLNGVWIYSAVNSTTAGLNNLSNLSYNIKGAGLYFGWRDLEPNTEGVYRWGLLDSAIQKVANANMYINLMIWVGPFSPNWIYNSTPSHQVDSVKTNDPDNTFQKYPYYFHPNYKQLWFKMLDSVILHLRNLQPSLKNKIKIFQSAQGTTGDLSFYKGTPTNTPLGNTTCGCTDYSITPTTWCPLVQREWQRTDSMLKIHLPNSHHLLNAGGDSPFSQAPHLQNYQWSRNNLNDAWYKAENMGHGYQLNDEVSTKTWYDSIANVTYSCIPKIRMRDEFDMGGSTTYTPATIPWTIYTTALNALSFGIDMWNIKISDLLNQSCLPALKFYSKYAGQKDAACSPGAFSALHDGLDAEDIVRFPTSIYLGGTSLPTGTVGMQRCVNIANSYSAYGALQTSPVDAQGVPANQMNTLGLNDVGWGIYANNYERFLTQWSPNSTSQGYWRQGPQSEPYGRFARGFDHATAKDTMFFDLDDNFFSTFPNNGLSTVKIRVVYLDSGTGTFRLKYDAVGHRFFTAKSYTATNTGSWISDTITITDGYFGNRCNHGTDLALINTDNKNEIFHMIEVIRVAPVIIGINEHHSPTNKLITYPNPTQNIITFDYSNYNEETFDELIIYNILGEKVYSTSMDNSKKQITIDLKHLPSGIYTSVLAGENTQLINKIIKQ